MSGLIKRRFAAVDKDFSSTRRCADRHNRTQFMNLNGLEGRISRLDRRAERSSGIRTLVAQR